MDCLKCLEDLTPYLDDELDDKSRDRVEKHINLCHSCDAEFRSLSVSYNLVDEALEAVEIRPELWDRVAADLPWDRTWKDRRPGWRSSLAALLQFPGRTWAASFTAVALLATIAFFWPVSQKTNAEIEGLRRQLNVMVEEMDRQDTLRHRTQTDPGRDGYGSNPFAPQHVSLDSNPFHSAEPEAGGATVSAVSGARSVSFKTEEPETQESR